MSLFQPFTVWRLAFEPRPFSLHRPEALRKAVAKDCTLIYQHQDWVGTL